MIGVQSGIEKGHTRTWKKTQMFSKNRANLGDFS
jgi:hypothetical protein